ncbi:MAG: hypothetical protein IJT16_08540 [Lachnospiraceae bacterium]|nr:hypothetical protein [Lachnospiraceae bacterium]
MNINGLSNINTSNVINKKKADSRSIEKPAWNGKKAFTCLEDMGKAGIEYGIKAKQYYTSKTVSDGEMSVDDLKKQIKEWFPEYTLTSSEPRDVVHGKHYLYIDDSQLKEMASNPAYRGQVYGLMDREYTTGQEYTLTYSDGVNKTMHLTGSVFSLSEANRKYAGPDGIPYHGSCTSDNSISSSASHIQVRSQSFLYDHLDPVRSAGQSRTLAARSQAEKLAEKRAEKKKAAEKEAKKAEQKRLDEKRKARRIAEYDRLLFKVTVKGLILANAINCRF